MEIALDSAPEKLNQISSYTHQEIVIGEHSYHQSIILSEASEIKLWQPTSIAEITAASWAELLIWQPKIVLLGTGKHLCFPAIEVLAPLIERNIGVEVMDTGAACRTFNVLVAEGRKVAAALLPMR